jgi:sirohydrochlorin ferrochelatase
MSQNPCQMVFIMTAAIASEMKSSLRLIAEPVHAGESIKALIAKAARRVGFEYWRTHDLWYGRARRIDVAELEAVRARVRAKEEAQANAEIAELRARLQRLESALAVADADFFGPAREALRGSMGGARRVADGGGE